MNINELSSKIDELKNKKSLNASEKIELKKLEKEYNKLVSPVEASGVFVTEDDSYDNSRVSYVDINKIKLNPYQPRKTFDQVKLEELSESIKEYGLLQPIVVADINGSYILIAGERRYRAHKLANLDKIKSMILTNKSDLEIKVLSIIENIQRADLSPLEEGLAYLELQKEGSYSLRDLEDIVNKNKNYIAARINLTKFDDDCIEFILNHGIKNVSKLLKILDAEGTTHSMLLEKLSKNDLTDEEIEKFYVDRIRKVPTPKEKTNTNTGAKEIDHDKFDENPDFSKDKKEASIEALTEKIIESQKENNAEIVENATIVKQTDSFLIKSFGEVVNITIDKSKLTGKDLDSILELIKSL